MKRSHVVDLTKARVKEEIVKEVLDPPKGAVVELNATNPVLTTSNTRGCRLYQSGRVSALVLTKTDMCPLWC